jgi:hypothetical protein
MRTVTIDKPQIKKHSTCEQRVKIARKTTFMDWLAEEAAAGRIIAPKNIKPTAKPERPEPGLDWWSAYEYSRADKF